MTVNLINKFYINLYFARSTFVCVCVCNDSGDVLWGEVCQCGGWVITVDSNPADGLAGGIRRSGGVAHRHLWTVTIWSSSPWGPHLRLLHGTLWHTPCSGQTTRTKATELIALQQYCCCCCTDQCRWKRLFVSVHVIFLVSGQLPVMWYFM